MIQLSARDHLIATLACCLLVPGCSEGLPPTAAVQGKVTWNGKPLNRGTIVFYPQSGRPATGEIDAFGAYRLSTFASGDGALPGSHTVTVEVTSTSSAAEEPKSMDEEVQRAIKGIGRRRPQVTWLIPMEYSNRETSPLKVEVDADNNNVIDLDLPPSDRDVRK